GVEGFLSVVRLVSRGAMTGTLDAAAGMAMPTARTPDSHPGVLDGPHVSIVMPSLNEEATVGICVTKARRWLEGAGLPGEVIVVDNGSTDASVPIAISAGAGVVTEQRRGYGSADIRGFAEAGGDVLAR